MVEFEKVRDLNGDKKRENLESKLDKQEALLEFVAMAADIYLPEEEDNGYGSGSDGYMETEQLREETGEVSS